MGFGLCAENACSASGGSILLSNWAVTIRDLALGVVYHEAETDLSEIDAADGAARCMLYIASVLFPKGNHAWCLVPLSRVVA